MSIPLTKNVYVRDSLHRLLKRMAEKYGVSMVEIADNALTAHVTSHGFPLDDPTARTDGRVVKPKPPATAPAPSVGPTKEAHLLP